jgi:hypothetical protein
MNGRAQGPTSDELAVAVLDALRGTLGMGGLAMQAMGVRVERCTCFDPTCAGVRVTLGNAFHVVRGQGAFFDPSRKLVAPGASEGKAP